MFTYYVNTLLCYILRKIIDDYIFHNINQSHQIHETETKLESNLHPSRFACYRPIVYIIIIIIIISFISIPYRLHTFIFIKKLNIDIL